MAVATGGVKCVTVCVPLFLGFNPVLIKAAIDEVIGSAKEAGWLRRLTSLGWHMLAARHEACLERLVVGN